MKAEKQIWRALRRHVEKNHTLRVRLVDEVDTDLQLECVFCGLPLMAGAPQIVNTLGEQLLSAGVKVVRPANQPHVRVQ